jgi:competence protein ComEC
MSHPADEERSRGFLTAPLLALSVAFALGIAAANAPLASLADTLQSVPPLLAVAGVFMLVGLILARARRPVLAGIFALTAFALAGTAAARLFEFRFSNRHVSHLEDLGIDLRDPVRVSGRLVSSPLDTVSGLQFDLEVSEIEDRGRVYPLTGKVRLRMRRKEETRSGQPGEPQSLSYGDSIRALVELQKPRVYRDPGVFDYRRWMASIQDIYWEGTIKNPLLIENLSRRGLPTLGELLNGARQRLLSGIDRQYPPWSLEGRDGAVLKAVLLGDRSALDSKTMDNFRLAGLYHLLVISGLHVGLLAMLVALLLRLTPLGELWRSALLLLFLLGYSSLVEQRAPTTRATIMIAAYLVARFFYRRHAALNAVGLAALALLIARPAWLFESGFELSFAAALLIVGLIAPILKRTTEPYQLALQRVNQVARDVDIQPRMTQLRLDIRRAGGWIAARLPYVRDHPEAATTAAALPLRVAVWTAATLIFTTILQIGLMLPLAATFHRVTYAGIGLNALAIPVMTILLAVALPTVLLGAVSPAVAAWPAKLVALIMRALFALTDLPHLPAWLSYRVPTPAAWVAWGFAISIIIAAWSLGRSRWAFWGSAAGLAVFAALISIDPFPARVPSGSLEVTMLDCGSGDAFLVVLPDRTTMLVDAGGGGERSRSEDPFESRRWTAAEDIVSPYLWSRQIKKLDVIIMSRGDESRLAGFAAIARNFHVAEFWYASSGVEPVALGFLDELGRRGIRTRAMESGERISRGSTSIQVLWPPGAPRGEATESASNRNRGMVIRFQDGESSVLFASDVSSRTELNLLQAHARLGAPLMALADPASFALLSKDFVGSISPRVVLVSGEIKDAEGFSPSGMPAAFQTSGSRVFVTGRDGVVTVEMQRSRISLRTYGMPAGEGTLGLASNASWTSSSLSVR